MATDGQQPDSAALIADAIDGIGQGLLIVGADGRIVRGNRRFCDLYGIDDAAIRPGLPFAEHLRIMAERGLITGTDPQKQIAQRLASLASRKDFTADRRLPNGTMIALTGHALPGGGYAFTFTDVTERTRQAETLATEVERRTHELAAREQELGRTVEALRASQRRTAQDQAILRATLDHMAQGILVVDERFGVQAYNARFLDLFGIDDTYIENPAGFRRLVRRLAERGDTARTSRPTRRCSALPTSCAWPRRGPSSCTCPVAA
jgi:PAS domain-containing protein